MFTGLIEEVGQVENIQKKSDGMILYVKAKNVLEDAKPGDSIAVNGVCLTAIDIQDNRVAFELSNETINRSNFKYVKINEHVNLERALKASDRLGGHIVQGHVDTTGKIVEMRNLGSHTELKIKIPDEYKALIIEKGSIAVDGISLTVNYIQNNTISINIIPHTLENTNLKYRKVGDLVNLEFDIFGKYILKFISNVDIKKLKESKLKDLLNGL